MSFLSLHPIPLLMQRTRAELSAAFSLGEVFIGRSPAPLDVMGGIAAETGSDACSIPLERLAAAALIQRRGDGLLQVFSFDELDAHRPFTLCMPMQALVQNRVEMVRAGLSEPGRRWAWSVLGAIWQLHAAGLLDARRRTIEGGLNVALLSTIPADAGMRADAAIAAASVGALLEQGGAPESVEPSRRAEYGRLAAESMLGRASGLADFYAANSSHGNRLTRWKGDEPTKPSSIGMPMGMRFVAIDTNVSTAGSEDRVNQARAATVMAHALILKKMRDMGAAAGRALMADPMGGCLARLDSNDYKRWFRPYLPEVMLGSEFLEAVGEHRPAGLDVGAEVRYSVRGLADHHVLEALRVRNFVRFIEQADMLPLDDPARGVALDKAGHLMYASHQSLSGDATLGISQADQLVRLVRQGERQGLYGARLTSSGCGGVVAVLCEDNERATAALADVLSSYAADTGRVPASYRTAMQQDATGENASGINIAWSDVATMGSA